MARPIRTVTSKKQVISKVQDQKEFIRKNSVRKKYINTSEKYFLSTHLQLRARLDLRNGSPCYGLNVCGL